MGAVTGARIVRAVRKTAGRAVRRFAIARTAGRGTAAAGRAQVQAM